MVGVSGVSAGQEPMPGLCGALLLTRNWSTRVATTYVRLPSSCRSTLWAAFCSTTLKRSAEGMSE